MPVPTSGPKALPAGPSKASTLDRRRASHRDASCAASRRKVLQRTVVLAGSALGLRRDPALADREESSATSSLRDWSQQDNRRMLHTVMVVNDIKEQQKFYNDVLGMQTLRYRSFEDGSANGFSGYLSEDLGFSLELVQKASPPEIRVGSGFRHYTVAVPSIEAAISRATERGLGIVEGTRFEQGEVYIRDPSGYLWEVQPPMPSGQEPFREMSMLVSDLEASERFYTEALAMRTINRESSAESRRVDVCWGDPRQNTVLSLTQPRNGSLASRPIDRGASAYVQVACSTDDVYRTAEALRAEGAAITREPAPVPGIGTKVMKVADPDGWTFAFVDDGDFVQELCKAGKLTGPRCEAGGAAA